MSKKVNSCCLLSSTSVGSCCGSSMRKSCSESESLKVCCFLFGLDIADEYVHGDRDLERGGSPVVCGERDLERAEVSCC